MNITYGSVCSGAGTCAMAFLPLGGKAVWFAEIEPAPSAVLAHHWPEVPNLGDMTTLPERILAREIPAPDIFMGGTPCQAFSVAGLRNSLDDRRGNLTLTFCEIANAIDAVRAADRRPPLVILWENVPGVLSVEDNAFGCFLGALAGSGAAIDAGDAGWSYAGMVSGPRRAAAWRVLDAQYFGVAQRRRRVFVVAGAGAFRPESVLFESEGVRRDSAPSRGTREGAAAGTKGGAGGGSRHSSHWNNGPHPPLSQASQARAGGIGGSNQEIFEQGGAGLVQGFGGNDTGGPISVAPALNANRGCHNPGDFEAGTLIAFPAEMSGTACASAEDVGIALSTTHTAAVASTASVRRLTPREYERLQGWPDDHTLVPYRGKPMADGPRYKIIGNGWALPCVQWIARRIFSEMRGR